MNNLRKERARFGKSQQDVADDLGVTQAYITQIEGGYRRPSDDLKIKISRYYGKSIEYLFFDELITNSDNEQCY